MNEKIHHEYDKSFKLLMPRGLIRYLKRKYRLKFENIRALNVNFVSETREVDILYKTNRNVYIHIEVQSRDDLTMLRRMSEYFSKIFGKYNEIPLQIVIYIGQGIPKMETIRRKHCVTVRYRLIVLNQIPASEFDNYDTVESHIISLISKYDNAEEFIEKKLKRVWELSEDKKTFTSHAVKAHSLLKLHKKGDLFKIIFKRMFPEFNVKETFIWEEAEEELGAKHKNEMEALKLQNEALAHEKDIIAHEKEAFTRRTIINLYFDLKLNCEKIAAYTGQTETFVREVIAQDQPNKN